MPTEQEIMNSLQKIIVPEVRRSLVLLNSVREISIFENSVKIKLAATALGPGLQQWVEDKATAAVKALPDVKDVTVEFAEAKPAEINDVSHVIAIMSGKGGVGKSMVSALTAVALKRQGYEVGILDADITGPSIPKMFGVHGRPAGSESGILPMTSKQGIAVMSINLLLPGEDEAVIWRGPLISSAITQFWQEVLWGKLDYLIVDLPPGTSDATLTVLSVLPVSGILVVFTPQDLTAMIVKKAVNMAKQMDKPVLGIVENMSYLYIPEIDKRFAIFGTSKAGEMAEATGAPLLGQLPIDPELTRLSDEGSIEDYSSPIFDEFTRHLLDVLPAAEHRT